MKTKSYLQLLVGIVLSIQFTGCSSDEPQKPEVFNIPEKTLSQSEFKSMTSEKLWKAEESYYLNDNFEIVKPNPSVIGGSFGEKALLDGYYFTEDGYVLESWSDSKGNFSIRIKIDYSPEDGVITYSEPDREQMKWVKIAPYGDKLLFIKDMSWNAYHGEYRYNVIIMQANTVASYEALISKYPIRDWH